MKAVTAVTDLVSARIYPMLAPQSADLPFVIYETTVAAPVNHAGGVGTTVSWRFAASGFASTYSGAKALGAAMESARSGWTDADGCIWHLESSSDDVGEVQSGRQTPEFYAVQQEYTVWR